LVVSCVSPFVRRECRVSNSSRWVSQMSNRNKLKYFSPYPIRVLYGHKYTQNTFRRPL
jgi:hypothetical protein